jgi:glycosyltransferase involved in cell wall biosynthesis
MPTGDNDVRLSIIIPTPGGPTVTRAAQSALDQMHPGDELLVVFDNTGDWGITPRNRALDAASGTHISFLDDDDVYVPGALEAIREFAREHPTRIGIFQMNRGLYGTVWVQPDPTLLATASGMYVVPNVPGRVGRYGEVPGAPDHDATSPGERYQRYAGLVAKVGSRSARIGDYRFIVETVALQSDPIWQPVVIQEVRPEQSRWARTRYRLRIRTRIKRSLGLTVSEPVGPSPVYPDATAWAEAHIHEVRRARTPD